MTNMIRIKGLEAALREGTAREGYYREAVEALLPHVRELYGFIGALVDHLDSPGPSPEKTAEHYQIAARARKLAYDLYLPAGKEYAKLISS